MPMIATFAPQTYINADLKQKWLPKDVFLAIFGVVLGCWPEQGRFLGNPKRESVSEGQSILTGSRSRAGLPNSKKLLCCHRDRAHFCDKVLVLDPVRTDVDAPARVVHWFDVAVWYRRHRSCCQYRRSIRQ